MTQKAEEPISKEQFEALKPWDRGYVVYMCGARADQPNVPDEANPYPEGSKEATAWDDGAERAALAAQDSEE